MGIVIVLIGIIVCIFPIAVISLIVSAIVKKNREGKGNFERIIRNIYIYIILILTFISILSGVIATFRIGLDVLLPERSVYESSYGSEQREKNQNIISLFTTMSLVIAVIPVFVYHNKLAKEARKVNVDEYENNEIN